MKIKTVNMDYEDVLKLPTYKHKNPQKQSAFFRKLIKALSAIDLKRIGFTYETVGMENSSWPRQRGLSLWMHQHLRTSPQNPNLRC